jgi:hypothetical protein
MCLNKITKKAGEPGVGYKSVERRGHGHFITGHAHPRELRRDRFIDDQVDEALYTDHGDPYRTGFHIFKNAIDAYNWSNFNVVVRVEYEKVSCEGMQYMIYVQTNEGRFMAPVVVARRVKRTSAAMSVEEIFSSENNPALDLRLKLVG